MDYKVRMSSGRVSKGLVVLVAIFIAASILMAAIDSSQASPQFGTFYKYFSQLISGPIIILLLPFGYKIDIASIQVIGTICAVFIFTLTLLVAYGKCRVPFLGIYITLWFAAGYVMYFLSQLTYG